ncbi:Cysteine and glycine-rich protein 1 [Podila epicladia]|nr:Cysteine and glycine-rich protein 1 [Podila epicladia]
MAPSTNITGIVTKCFQCHRIIGNKSIRLGGMNYHPDCFKCTHCHKVLQSTSRFFEVDGRVECEQCCEERDRERLAPKIVPVARKKDNFAVPPPAVPAMVGHTKTMEPSGPGMMATGASPVTGYANNLVRSGSGYGSPNGSGQSSPVRSPASPAFSYPAHLSPRDQDVSSPVIMMASPSAIRSTPPVLTSLFSTRTRPLPKFGGVTTCPRCQQAVGVMDQVPGPKNEKWHKKCLNCKDCKKNLDSSAMTRGEGEAYCRGCFNKTRVRV